MCMGRSDLLLPARRAKNYRADLRSDHYGELHIIRK